MSILCPFCRLSKEDHFSHEAMRLDQSEHSNGSKDSKKKNSRSSDGSAGMFRIVGAARAASAFRAAAGAVSQTRVRGVNARAFLPRAVVAAAGQVRYQSATVKDSEPVDPADMPAGTVELNLQKHETQAGTVMSGMQPYVLQRGMRRTDVSIFRMAEIKDPAVIFNTVWKRLEAKYGVDNLTFPSEVVWLMGAPGAGKGTNTPFIQHARGITNAPIVISDLLKNDNTRQMINSGVMISARIACTITKTALLTCLTAL